jgi:hypothetical protein
MNLKKIQVELDTAEIQQVLVIALDDDKEKALEFIREKLFRRVEKALQPH